MSCACEGLQTPQLFSYTRKIALGERSTTESSLMVKGGHISHHGTCCLPFPFNQSGKFTSCSGWRFTHAMSLHYTEHAAIELDYHELRVRFGKKMCDGPESYPISKHEESHRQADHNRSRDESQHA